MNPFPRAVGSGGEWELREEGGGSLQARSVKGQQLRPGTEEGAPHSQSWLGSQGPVCLGGAGPLGGQVCNNSSHFLPY